MPNNEHHLRYLKMCDVILKVADKEVNMWNVDDFLSKYLRNSWIFRLVMKLLIYSMSLLSLVSLARSGCTENQYGKDGCEPEPFLCRHLIVILVLLILSINIRYIVSPGLSVKKMPPVCWKKTTLRHQFAANLRPISPFPKTTRALQGICAKQIVKCQTQRKMTRSDADSGDL